MIRQSTLYRKRRPVDWRRYAAYVRRAERKLGRRRHPLAATIVGTIVLGIMGTLFAQAVGVGIGAGMADLGESLVSSLPQSQDSDLVIGGTQVTVSTAPILDTLPEFIKGNEMVFAGRVPVYALRPDSLVSVSVNGRHFMNMTIAPDGHFGGVPVVLQDGPNTIKAVLLEGSGEIATTSHTVTVDRTAPALKIVRPAAGETVTGDVVVEGTTEAAADVTVNDRAVRPNPDGSFSERIVAPPGPLVLAISVKDKAGNETKTELGVIVAEAKAPVAGLTLAVALDRALVKPGETVVAEIFALQDGRLRPDLPITLQVGVVTIGTYRTDANGSARIGFAAPNHEVENVAVVVLGGGTTARASFTVAKPATPSPSPRP